MRAWILLAVTAAAAVVFGAPQPWRTLAVVAFLSVVPGVVLLRFVPGTDRLTRAALAVGGSFALAAVLSEGLAIAGVFSATALFLMLAGVSVLGCVLPGRAR